MLFCGCIPIFLSFLMRYVKMNIFMYIDMLSMVLCLEFFEK